MWETIIMLIELGTVDKEGRRDWEFKRGDLNLQEGEWIIYERKRII